MKVDSRLAYTAGFIEADGCFHLGGSCSIRVTNKHVGTLERFKEWYGGTILSKGSPSYCWDWNLHAKEASALASELLPYLYMKEKQAKLIIEYQTLIGKRGEKVTKEVLEAREHIKKQLKETRNYGS